jgi:acyl-coenzyme A thioesterase 13
VSTDLNVTYLSSGGKIGDLIKAEVTCDKCEFATSIPTLPINMPLLIIPCLVGKTLAFTSINFSNNNGEVFARGSHTKYVALAWKDPNNIVEELSPKPEK